MFLVEAESLRKQGEKLGEMSFLWMEKSRGGSCLCMGNSMISGERIVGETHRCVRCGIAGPTFT